MKNLASLMKQAQKAQEKMQEMQASLESLEVEGNAAAGMVKVTMNGKHVVRSVSIDPTLIKADEAEVLEDLLVAAINDANARVEAVAQEKMQEVTGGMNLPAGMKMPF
ncbi:YbaB/EbfC family nucleoid-associated protein [Kiloniella sp. b19]|uniref:YbaB/EbfC family nucleoid-associated protein n=1 Tax=Kiloniella sp. GXU_MW_B19 TaxID=3141326 RepID=UPI0031D220A2